MTTRYDKRLSEIEKKIGEAGKLPLSARGPYVGWGDDAEETFAGIRKDLMERFGTTEGAKFIAISWGSPDTGVNGH